jgi:hypothetical protein
VATEEQKKARLIRLFNNLVYGYAHGLYEMFDEAMLSTVSTIGEDILEDMENDLGLEIHGESPQVILTEIERLLIDEYGMAKRVTLTIDDDTIGLVCEDCVLWKATEDLKAAGVPPYTCLPMTLATAALRKRLGLKARFVSIEQEMDKRICDIEFELL